MTFSDQISDKFLTNRRVRVKWNGHVSLEKNLNGGGPQGGLLVIIEYFSQSNNNKGFLLEDESVLMTYLFLR